MKRIITKLVLLIILSACYTSNCHADKLTQNKEKSEMNSENKLAVLWTSDNKDVAEKMVFMYVYNAAKFEWWNEINFIIWGPSSKLLSEDKDLQDYIKKMQKVGIQVYACKACADMYKVSDKLEMLNIDVKYMGKPLTEYLQSDYKVITF